MPQRKPPDRDGRKKRRLLNEPIESALVELDFPGIRELRRMTVSNPERPIHGKEPVRTFKHLQWLLHDGSFKVHPLRPKVVRALEVHLSREGFE